jgi:hypothetical protein
MSHLKNNNIPPSRQSLAIAFLLSFRLYLSPLVLHLSIFSSLRCSFHCRCCYLFWHSMILRSFNILLSWRYLTVVAVSARCNMPFNSLFLLILQHSVSVTAPHIFHTVFFQIFWALSISSLVTVQVPYFRNFLKENSSTLRFLTINFWRIKTIMTMKSIKATEFLDQMSS